MSNLRHQFLPPILPFWTCSWKVFDAGYQRREPLRVWRREVSSFRRSFFALNFAILKLFLKGFMMPAINAAANYDLDAAEWLNWEGHFLTDFDLFFALKKASKKDRHRTAFPSTKRHPFVSISSSTQSWLTVISIHPFHVVITLPLCKLNRNCFGNCALKLQSPWLSLQCTFTSTYQLPEKKVQKKLATYGLSEAHFSSLEINFWITFDTGTETLQFQGQNACTHASDFLAKRAWFS